MIGQYPAAGEHPSILFGVQRAEVLREHHVGGAPQQFLAVFEAAAPGQGLVDEGVTGFAILDEKHHVGQGIEQRRDRLKTVKQRR
ncbi:hypothetical protein D3C73_1537280 [compost metagenome]